MLRNHFRPWGLLEWVLPRVPKLKWSIMGCLSTEDRCITALQNTKRLLPELGRIKFIQVEDPPSNYSDAIAALIGNHQEQLFRLGVLPRDIEKHQLFQQVYKLKTTIDQFVSDSQGDIIIDISSFPKRFFFPIIKLLISSGEVKNLIAAYTVAGEYSLQALAEDPEPWAHIPLFGPSGYPSRNLEAVVVGVGFLPFGLPELLKNEYHNIIVKYFFVPFPPGPPPYHRTWEFLREIERYTHLKPNMLRRINAYDVSDTFDNIYSITKCSTGLLNTILAPYGPKPISLGMCLYASLTDSPVYYTQPKTYNPNYCSGIKRGLRGYEETYMYCLRLDGRDFYELNEA